MPPTSTVPRPGSNSSTTPSFSPGTTKVPSSLLIIFSVHTRDRTWRPLLLVFRSWGMGWLLLGAVSLCYRSSGRILLPVGPGCRTSDTRRKRPVVAVASWAVAFAHPLLGEREPFQHRGLHPLLVRH